MVLFYMKKPQKISNKFIIMAIVSLVFAVAITGVMSYLFARMSLIEKLQSSDLRYLASLKAEKIDNRLASAIETSMALADDPVLSEWFNAKEKNPVLGELSKKKLSQMVETFKYTNAFAVNALTDNYHWATKQTPTYLNRNFPENQWYVNALKSGVKKQININSNRKDDGLQTFVFINILMGDPFFPKGIAGISIDFNAIATEFTHTDKKYDAKIWLVDKKGNIKISENVQDLSKSIAMYVSEPVKDQIVENYNSTNVIEYNNPKKGKVDLIHVPLTQTDWVVVYEVPRSKTTASLNSIGLSTVIVCIISIIIVIFVFYYGTHSITNPILSLVNSFSALALGDVKQKIANFPNDEIGVLSANFNAFTEILTGIIEIVKETSDSLAISAKEVSKAAIRYSDNAGSQAATTEEITASIESIDSKIHNISNHIAVQSKNLNQLIAQLGTLTKVIHDMNEVIELTMNNISSISKEATQAESSLQTMQVSMSSIRTSSNDVAKIVRIIADILKKINLLSLNAAIEAQRAGDSGKGFEVVADEISKLAERTAVSIKEIELIIQKNNSQTSDGITNIQTLIKKINSILLGVNSMTGMVGQISDFMQKQIAINQTVEAESTLVRDLGNQIEDDILEQKNSFGEIVKSISVINEITQANSAESHKLADNSVQVASMADSLKQQVEFFRL
jgi:methyl-accepting chemotaxis protein